MGGLAANVAQEGVVEREERRWTARVDGFALTLAARFWGGNDLRLRARRELSVDERGLSIEGTLVARHRDVRWGYVESNVVHLVNRRGAVFLRAELPSVDEARSLLASLGIEPGSTFALFYPWSVMSRARAMFIVLSSGFAAAFGITTGHPGMWMLGLPLAFAMSPVVGGFREVTVGRSGLRIAFGPFARFIEWSRVRGARRAGKGVELELTDGATLRLGIEEPADRRRNLEGLAEAIDLAARSDPSPSGAAHAALEREIDRSRPLPADGGGARYRVPELDSELLWAVAEDPDAAPSVRLGAARRLLPRLDEPGRRRMRRAASLGSTRRVRVALEAAAEGDPEPLERALRREGQAG
jgi:hypothetical protein